MLLILETMLIVLLSAVLFTIRKEESAWNRAHMPRGIMERCWDGAERRRYVRIERELDVRYEVEKTRDMGAVATRDISERGMRLLTDKKLERGAVITMQITHDACPKPIVIKAAVVWCNEAKDAERGTDKRFFHAGVKFVKTDRESAVGFEALMRALEETLKAQGV